MASVIKQVQGSPLQPRCALDSLHVICFQTMYRMNTIACGSKGGTRQHIDNEMQEHNLSNRNVIYIYGFGGITVPPVNGSEAVAFVSMPLKSIRVVADLAFLHNEQIMHCQMF